LRVEPGLPLSRDADDDKFLHLAAAADAVALVTGDRDLLVLGEFAGIPILSPSRFLRAERSIRRGRQARGG
jgi:predicted nucleic acid-binding protein